MKLTLDQLKVDSYSTQICETELTEIKGGSWFFCSCAAAKPAMNYHPYEAPGGGAGSRRRWSSATRCSATARAGLHTEPVHRRGVPRRRCSAPRW